MSEKTYQNSVNRAVSDLYEYLGGGKEGTKPGEEIVIRLKVRNALENECEMLKRKRGEITVYRDSASARVFVTSEVSAQDFDTYCFLNAQIIVAEQKVESANECLTRAINRNIADHHKLIIGSEVGTPLVELPE